MSKTVKKPSRVQATSVAGTLRVEIPPQVAAVLANTRSAFFGLCVEAGRQVLEAMMEHDRTALCGPRHRHDTARTAQRAGSAPSAVTLGGRRIEMRRLRARSLDGRELDSPWMVPTPRSMSFVRHDAPVVSGPVGGRGQDEIAR